LGGKAGTPAAAKTVQQVQVPLTHGSWLGDHDWRCAMSSHSSDSSMRVNAVLGGQGLSSSGFNQQKECRVNAVIDYGQGISRLSTIWTDIWKFPNVVVQRKGC